MIKVLVSQAIVDALMEKDPSIAIDIAEKIKIETGKMVIKKFLNDSGEIKKVQEIIDRNLKPMLEKAGLKVTERFGSFEIMLGPAAMKKLDEELVKWVNIHLAEAYRAGISEMDKMLASKTDVEALVETVLDSKIEKYLRASLGTGGSMKSVIDNYAEEAVNEAVRRKLGL